MIPESSRITLTIHQSRRRRALGLIRTILLSLCITSLFYGEAVGRGWRDEEPRDYPPSKVPDRIVLTWAGDPATSQAVTWRTDTSVMKAYAEIALATVSPEFEKHARRVPAGTERQQTGKVIAHHHSVNFTGLQPKTLYAYRVGAGDDWSEWFQFGTASREREPFTFLYFGDGQEGLRSQWSRVVRAACLEAPGARFIIHSGDLVDDGYVDGFWGEWFEAGGWIWASVPSIPVPGNHEYGDNGGGYKLTESWKPHFTLPETGPDGLEERAYFVDYQGVRVVGLNSKEKLSEQAGWLAQVLADNPNRWTVLTFHHPIFSAARNRDNEEMRGLWKPIMDKYGVDLVLQGHDHVYARGRGPQETFGSGGGAVYVISMSGPKMYGKSGDRWMDRAGENIQLFQVISVTPDTLHYRAMTPTGEVYDAFDLVKRPGGPNQLIDLAPATPEHTFESD